MARVHREASVHFRVGPVSLCPRYRIGLAFTSLRCGSCSARIEVAADAAIAAAIAAAAAAATASTNAEHGSHFHSPLIELPCDKFNNESASTRAAQPTYSWHRL